jgi:hypothetical protein
MVGVRRLHRIAAVMAVAIAAGSVAGGSHEVAPTLAAWNDAEFVVANLGTLDCAPSATGFVSRASGKLLDGSVGGVNLGTVADLHGVTVETTGETTRATPSEATLQRIDAQTYADPLSVSALGSVNADLGGLLLLPIPVDVAAVRSYASARGDGRAVGASGTVTNTGAIGTATTSPAGNAPAFATVNLGRVIDFATGSGAGGVISGLSDARLSVGAVASTATLDGCAAMWAGDIYANLERNYLVSSLDLRMDSPLVKALASATSANIAAANTSVRSLAGNPGVISNIRAGITSLLSGRLGALGLGDISVSSLTVDVDVSAVNALIGATVSDPTGLVVVDLANGYVTVDLAQLVDGTHGVNGLPPNTSVPITTAMATKITAAVTEATALSRAALTRALTTALNSARVSATVTVDLKATAVPLARITLKIPTSPLSALIAGSVAATSSVSLLGGTCAITNPLACTVDTVLSTVVPVLVAGTGAIVGQAVSTALTGTGGVLATSGTGLASLADPLVAFAGRASTRLLGEGGVLSLTVNAQNRPDPSAPHGTTEPAWAASLPAPDPVTGSSGRFDVSAVRLTGADGALAIDFARSSVGAVVPLR